jgi:hypothetical protein
MFLKGFGPKATVLNHSGGEPRYLRQVCGSTSGLREDLECPICEEEARFLDTHFLVNMQIKSGRSH